MGVLKPTRSSLAPPTCLQGVSGHELPWLLTKETMKGRTEGRGPSPAGTVRSLAGIVGDFSLLQSSEQLLTACFRKALPLNGEGQ